MAGFRFSKNFCAVFQFKCDSILHVRLASHSMILLCPSSPSLFPSRDTYNGTASEADRNIISNHVITFQISNFNTFCFPQIPIISYPVYQRFFSRFLVFSRDRIERRSREGGSRRGETLLALTPPSPLASEKTSWHPG